MICDNTTTDDDATEGEEEEEIAGLTSQSHEEEEGSVAKRWGKQRTAERLLWDTAIQGAPPLFGPGKMFT